MTTITRRVLDISPADRSALEHVLGVQLHDDQKVMFQIDAATSESPELPDLPAYLRVYEGSSDAEIAAIENAVLRRDRTPRSIE